MGGPPKKVWHRASMYWKKAAGTPEVIDREPIGTVRTVLTRRRRFVLLARRDWEIEITLDVSDVTAHGTLPARYWTCEIVALRTRPVDPVFLDRLQRIGELRPDALEAWQRVIGRPARDAVAG